MVNFKAGSLSRKLEMRRELDLPRPCDKHDIENAAALVALKWSEVECIVPEMLEWLQDINWPVAGIFGPFLADAGASLAPFIQPIFAADDAIWTYNLLRAVVGQSPALATELASELERMANRPTFAEHTEGVPVLARQILAGRARCN